MSHSLHHHSHHHHSHDCSASHHHQQSIDPSERLRRNRELYSAFLTVDQPEDASSASAAAAAAASHHGHSHDHDHQDHYINEQDQLEEDFHMATVLESFSCYERFHMAIQHRVEQSARTLLYPTEDSDSNVDDLLPKDFLSQYDRAKAAIRTNYDFICNIIASYVSSDDDTSDDEAENFYGRKVSIRMPDLCGRQVRIGLEDQEKVRSTLKQFVRDWSTEGQQERQQCYGIILDELTRQYPRREDRSKIRVLTPGAGLGRLSFEIARLGFDSQGNEFSFYMLLASNFILNGSERIGQFNICPYVHQRSNLLKREDQLHTVQVPDVNISSELPKDCGGFSMVAGDFIEVYGSQPGEWDCIVTCFFLDTAKCVLDYIAVIERALKPGGLWINLGPLLWHYEEMPNQMSIELSYDELRFAIVKKGFEMGREQQVRCSYSTNPRSMMQVQYQCQFFTARKPLKK